MQTWQIEVSALEVEWGKNGFLKVSKPGWKPFFVSNLCPEQKPIVMQKRTYSSIIFPQEMSVGNGGFWDKLYYVLTLKDFCFFSDDTSNLQEF